MVTRARQLAVPALVLAGLLGGPLAGTALADSPSLLIDVPGDGHGWVHDSDRPLLDLHRLAPGMTASSTLSVENDTDAAASLALSSLNIADDDNGCDHPESLVDHTCGPGQGDLGHALVFKVYLDPAHRHAFPATPSWSGSIYDLAKSAELTKSMPAHGVWDLKIEADFPPESGNETQTDQLGFDLRLSAASDLGTTVTQVDGETIHRSGGGLGASVLGTVRRLGPVGALGAMGVSLPYTGAPLGVAVWTGAILVGVGALLTRAVRRRRVTG